MIDNRAHFLMIGDGDDIPMIQTILRRLPVDAYGQVMVEVATPLVATELEAPDGVGVTWMYRYREGSPFAPVRERGELAARAIRAWMVEWMPDDDSHEVPLVLWIGCSENEHVDRTYWDLRTRFPELHLHHPHYDGTTSPRPTD